MDFTVDYCVDKMEVTSNTSGYYQEIFNYLMDDLADHRTNDWFLVRYPLVFPIIIFYLFLVLKIIPRFMKQRKPYELKIILILYNLIQVLISIGIVALGITAGWFTETNFRCEPVDTSYSRRAMLTALGCHYYYLAKYTELLDTVFFALRKKYNQITFLHLYHHSVMPLISWGAIKYYPGGHGSFIGMINSMVHIVMYAYYLFAAMGPQYQKYLWWKKYITTMQLLQFCLIFLHHIQLVFYDCGYPRWVTILVMPNVIFFYYLFSDFYSKAYTKNKKNLGVTNNQTKENIKLDKESTLEPNLNTKSKDVLNGDIAKKTM